MKKLSFLISFLLIVFVFSTQTSCRKDKITDNPSAKLEFSIDTIIFDTVFTTIGSTTRRFKIYNRNANAVEISSITLKGGNNSPFRINVDGLSGNTHKNILIPGKDSLYVFVEVTIDPNNTLSPFIVEEDIQFITNGNNQTVHLVAWGQNAHYYTPKNFVPGLPPYSCLDGDCDTTQPPVNMTWINDKPYVIYGYLVVDENDILTIDKGCRIHFHNNSGLWVYENGTLKVNGTLNEPVTFQGDRLENAYSEIAGQWDRIWLFEGSVDNEFNYAIIKNAFIGIQAETNPFNPSAPTATNNLLLNETVIRNCVGAGLLAKNYKIVARNSIISNCGQYTFLVTGGGEYEFNHCTLANFWSESTRNNVSVYLQNYYTDINGATQVRDIVKCDFNNTIIDGANTDEWDYDVLSPGSINFKFTNCVLKTTKSTASSSYINPKQPSSSMYVDYTLNNYHLVNGSSAINNGDVSIGLLFPTDLDGNSRTADIAPDIGAYEK